MRKIGKNTKCFMALFAMLIFCILPYVKAEAGSIYSSPYVEIAPDGQAWTTCPGDTHNHGYDEGFTVDTGVESTLWALQTGEHYYKYDRIGDIPVGEWKVVHEYSQCIHDGYPEEPDYHGIAYGKQICEAYYTQGWYAYCADCNQKIAHILMYLCEDAAESITSIPMGMDYYYLCPFCTNLEQGAKVLSHECESISWNRYQIVYKKNTVMQLTGGSEPIPTYHMYNNATVYEGDLVTPNTRLAKMNATILGYEFVGWNTKPDGSGTWYADEQEIYNLTEYDSQYDIRGTITLYAQWKQSESTLVVDPAGGSYLGNGGTTAYTRPFGSNQILYSDTIAAPAGATLHFQSNGGSAVEDIVASQHFDRWEASEPFGGRLVGNTYYFIGKDGNVDRLKAVYMPDAITLPSAEKENSTFGGWYYDEECKKPAGAPGDKITIDKDTTLYAHWVELKLDSKENYSVNSGKGAADLWWSQPDLYRKAYRLYRSTDSSDWILINSTLDETHTLTVSENLAYSGASKTYTVPYTGIYQLTAAGARGGNYGTYKGGLGGKTEGTFWLNEGDVLTYSIGATGENGSWPNGGKNNTYSNGGGYTVVTSQNLGTLLIAGGGGGGSPAGNGGAGGLTNALLSTSAGGGNKQAGGGGGYRGGAAGEYVYHTHNTTSCGYHTHQGNETSGGACYKAEQKTGTCTPDIGGFADTSTWECGECGGTVTQDSYHSTDTECGGEHANYWFIYCDGPCGYDVVEGPSEHDYVYTAYAFNCTKSEGWQCGKSDAIATSSTPAYGGSSYINTDICNSYAYHHGDNDGDGYFAIRSENIGFVAELSAEGVPAPDLAAPDGIVGKTVAISPIEAANDRIVIVTWQVPSDKGTDYYFKVESHRAMTGEMLCTSNIRMHTITTGVKGYYYLVDTSPSTVVITENAVYIEDNSLQPVLTEEVQYLHLAPVDVAGNLGETTTIRLGSVSGGDAPDVVIPWPVYTEQMHIKETEGVYPAQEENTFYVRCDDATPLELGFDAYIDGVATSKYQITHSVFLSQLEGAGTAQNLIITPLHDVVEDEIVTSGDGLYTDTEGISVLKPYLYHVTTRTNGNRNLAVVSQFLIGSEADGKTVRVTPTAAVVTGKCNVYSDSTMDLENSLYLIGDGTGPAIQGTEPLEEELLIDREAGKVILNLQAIDAVSGLSGFQVDIYNEDNGGFRSWTADESGSITIDLTGDSTLFAGDFTITMTAIDNVENVSEEIYHMTELALETKVERKKVPHEPVFKRGESGVLTIETWGHVERVEVEFPGALSSYNETFENERSAYKTEESIQFMIPLYGMEDGEYEIRVRVHKGLTSLEEFLTISVSGTILDELRTRLR